MRRFQAPAGLQKKSNSTEGKTAKSQMLLRLSRVYRPRYNSNISQTTLSPHKIKLSSPMKPNPPLNLRLGLAQRGPSPKHTPPILSHRNQKPSPQHQHVESPQPLTLEARKRMEGKHYPHLKETQRYCKRERTEGRESEMGETMRMLWSRRPKETRYTFKMLKKLGKAQSGAILLCRANSNRVVLAIKTFKKSKVKVEFLIEETKIHLYSDHPHILPAYGLQVCREEVYLMMEVGQCNLYDLIIKQAPLS